MGELRNANTTNLAYVGDAVYEVFVRRRLFGAHAWGTKLLHREAIRYVSAAGQALAMKAMLEELSEEDQRLVKRARNHQSATRPKNQDPVDYKWATALEALVGFYYLSGDTDKAEALSYRAMEIIDAKEEQE